MDTKISDLSGIERELSGRSLLAMLIEPWRFLTIALVGVIVTDVVTVMAVNPANNRPCNIISCCATSDRRRVNTPSLWVCVQSLMS